MDETLLVPAALACVDAIARALRGGGRLGWALAWSAGQALPLLGALMALYLMAALGIVASPTFPFDPNSYGIGAGQVIAMVFLALVMLAGFFLIRSSRETPASCSGIFVLLRRPIIIGVRSSE